MIFIPLNAASSLPYRVMDLVPTICPQGALTVGGFPKRRLGRNHSGPTYKTIEAIKK